MLKPTSRSSRFFDAVGVVAAVFTVVFSALCGYALFGKLTAPMRPAGKFSLRIGSGIGVPLAPGRIAQVRP